MHHFTIKDIENLCSIKAHTLRMWEQRYNFFSPKRKHSNHRFYDNEDLKHLLRVSFLYHHGHKISAISKLDPAEICIHIDKITKDSGGYEIFITRLIEACIDLDADKFDTAIDEYISGSGIENCIREIFYPFLERIGRLWLTNNVIPAQEHFSSHLIQKKIIAATDALKTTPGSPYTVAVFCMPGEYHEIPVLVANYFFKRNNINTVYFGVNIAAETLNYYQQYRHITHLYTHVITNFTGEKLEAYISRLCLLFSEKQLLVSGPGSKNMAFTTPAIQVFHSLEEVIVFAKNMHQ